MSEVSIQISFTLADIGDAAHQLWQWANGARVFTFSGSLGAGKTTLVHALCDMLKVTDTVSSPTFALINEYRFPGEQGAQKIFHMDWYRLRDAEEGIDAGMEDALNDTTAICFIEWPEKAPELLRLPHIRIHLSLDGEWERRLIAERIEGDY